MDAVGRTTQGAVAESFAFGATNLEIGNPLNFVFFVPSW
jgi:hypothetical protein